jgi:hypothetical protein
VDRQRKLRVILWAAAGFNVGGAIAFGFPESLSGRLMALPAGVPALYRALTALFILLFGGAYAWTAHRVPLFRPFVVFGAIGKAAAFAAAVLVWLAGACALDTVLVMSGDLVFAALFAWGLAGAPAAAAATR